MLPRTGAHSFLDSQSRAAHRISGARYATRIWTRAGTLFAQGLTMKRPRRICDAFYSSAGMLSAQRMISDVSITEPTPMYFSAWRINIF
jgi:hypothetical protein